MSDPRRLFHPELPTSGGEIELAGESAHHAAVLRLSVGDSVLLFDGAGREAEGQLARVEGGQVTCRVGPAREVERPAVTLNLVLGMPKGAALDDAVRNATEVGAATVHLADVERSVVQLDAARGAKRVERLARIAREASRQSRRADVPELFPPAPLLEAAARAPDGALRLVFAPHAKTPVLASLEGASTAELVRPASAWIVVGPEGGLSGTEIEALEERGYRSVGLGSSTLRVPTAVAVALGVVSAWFRREAGGRSRQG